MSLRKLKRSWQGHSGILMSGQSPITIVEVVKWYAGGFGVFQLEILKIGNPRLLPWHSCFVQLFPLKSCPPKIGGFPPPLWIRACWGIWQLLKPKIVQHPLKTVSWDSLFFGKGYLSAALNVTDFHWTHLKFSRTNASKGNERKFPESTIWYQVLLYLGPLDCQG